MAKNKHSNPQISRRSPQPKVSAYLLWHTDRFGDEKLVGVYESEADASSAIERVKDKPGFSEEGGAFQIASYELNKDHWTEGFVRREGCSLPAWFQPPD